MRLASRIGFGLIWFSVLVLFVGYCLLLFGCIIVFVIVWFGVVLICCSLAYC